MPGERLTKGWIDLFRSTNISDNDHLRTAPSTKLCDRCGAISLRKTLQSLSKTLADYFKEENPATLEEGFRISDLDRADTWRPAECALCFLFEDVRLRAAKQHPSFVEKPTQYYLIAIPLCVLVSRKGKSSYKHLVGNEQVVLAVCPENLEEVALKGSMSLIASSPGLLQLKDRVGTHAHVLGRQFDARLVRKWLLFCRKSHHFCWNDEVHGGKHMPALLVDCFSRRIIQPKQAETYIALSYVWGQTLPLEREGAHESDNSTSTSGNLSILPPKLPQVIDDAISVAKELSIRYLWVDRYCIDQKNEQQKAREISQMHQIFSGAILTIVAAAGTNAAFGLPGTKTTPRSSSAKANVNGVSLHIIPPDPENAVDKSAWTTRGWTYQEMILSGRRLYFTSTEVFYECRRWRYREAIDEPQGYLPDTGKGRSLESNSHVLEINIERAPPKSLFYHIENYTRRSLTYEGDAYPAFGGILSYYENLIEPWYHAWGLVLGGAATSEEFRSGFVDMADCFPLKYLARSLMWSHARERAPCTPNEPHRVSECPSWSWLGWTGEKSMRICHFSPKYERGNELQAACVELADGRSIPIQSIQDAKLLTENAPYLSHHMRLKAPVVSFWNANSEFEDPLVGNACIYLQGVSEENRCVAFVDRLFEISPIFTAAKESQPHALILGKDLWYEPGLDKNSLPGPQDLPTCNDRQPYYLLRILFVKRNQDDSWFRIDCMVVYVHCLDWEKLSPECKELRLC